ncbi:cdc42 homolog [Oppia nitens]|uniref:cdc42 homolog n=1 Tax=Oppia nitens TaxID=1686743 RepID=UPI0023DBDAFB|nr:cdc42 homolog [Oppia nitens]
MSQFYYKRHMSVPYNSRPISIGDGLEAYPLPVKCTVIGDCSVGKTSLLISYTTGAFSTQYVPTIFDNYHKEVICDGILVDLELSDTAGLEDKRRIRSMSYLETDVFVVCFSIVSPKSFHNVVDKWIPEIKECLPNKPFILVGTKCDLRTNNDILNELHLNNDKPIDRLTGQRCAARLGAVKYLECSADTKLGVNQIFDESVRKALEMLAYRPVKHKSLITCCIS